MKIETQVGLFIFVAIGIFFYLSFNIGALRFDGSSYFTYKAYFDDTRGLEKKSNVKIAGVPVGRVEQRTLMENGLAEVVLSVHCSHKLFRNAYATITSDGLIGGSTLEIDPGDSSNGVLAPGSNLPMPGKTSATVGDLVESAKEITDSIQDVISAFHGVFATPEGERLLSSGLKHAVNATKKLSEFSVRLDDLVNNNQTQIRDVCDNVSVASEKLKDAVTSLQDRTATFADNAVDASASLKASGKHLSQTLKNTESVTGKVSRGEGTLGKLVHDEGLYADAREAVVGVKKLVNKASSLAVSLDGGGYSCYHTGNKKGFAEVKLFPQSDYYYSIQLSSECFPDKSGGPIVRKNTYVEYYDKDANLIDTNDPSLSLYQKARCPAFRPEVVQNPDGYFFGFQVCKKFNDLTLRVGLHEGQVGVGLDYDFPIQFKNFRWVMSVDAFDFQGRNRLADSRPHVTFSNKIFFMRSLYSYVGFDDIFSASNGSFFWGMGIAFDDDDLKYLLPFLPKV